MSIRASPVGYIELIASRYISSNQIEFTEELENCFSKNWKRYVGESFIFKPKAGTPFWHLNSEPFWQLIPFEGGYKRIVELQKGNPYSPSTIRKNIKYAVIDKNLYELLQDEENRQVLIKSLIDSLDK